MEEKKECCSVGEGKFDKITRLLLVLIFAVMVIVFWHTHDARMEREAIVKQAGIWASDLAERDNAMMKALDERLDKIEARLGK